MKELGSWLNTQRRQVFRWGDPDEAVGVRESVAVATEGARLDLLATARQWEGERPVMFLGGLAGGIEVSKQSVGKVGPAREVERVDSRSEFGEFRYLCRCEWVVLGVRWWFGHGGYSLS